MDKVRSLVLAGLSGGSGKSVVSVGLIAALRAEAGTVIPFKKGPDYIDAGWMSKAAQTPCYNLDPYLVAEKQLRQTFFRHVPGYAYAVVEGNRGIFDGVSVEGEYSTAELAVLLDLPVLLVVNCSKTTRTVAAQVLGCKLFDPRVRFAGVILNQIATSRHESIIRQAVERYTDLPVLGIMPRLKQDIFPMRHLGVTPHQEYAAAADAVQRLAALAREHFDLPRIIKTMQPAVPEVVSPPEHYRGRKIRIGILRDAAFQFYYEENLEALERGGAELITVDALHSPELPVGLDGLYIGGGFPETSAQQLADNVSFRRSIREHIDAGLPVYAECGGLIFLGRSIVVAGQEYPLANVFPVTFGLSTKPQAHGYSRCLVEKETPFYPAGTVIKGHEFRYSIVQSWQGQHEDLALKVERGTGFSGGRDGLMKNNALALYTHVLASGTPEWVAGFLQAAERFSLKK